MLALPRIDQIVTEVARRTLRADRVHHVQSGAAIDSLGRDALKVLIVLSRGAATAIDGDQAISTILQIKERLSEEGDDRFPVVEYAEDGEVEEEGDADVYGDTQS